MRGGLLSSRSDQPGKRSSLMSHKITAAALAAAAMLCAAGAAQAADVQIHGILFSGLYYTNPQHGDDSLRMTGVAETPLDPTISITAREDLGSGRYVGVDLGTTFLTDSGELGDDNVLFDTSRLMIGNDLIEVSAGRFGGFTVAATPYSVLGRLDANKTRVQLAGIAPANIMHRPVRGTNAVAFSTKAQRGLFVQGFYTNGDADSSGDEENLYDWSDRVHIAQAAVGWVGDTFRFGAVYTYEMPGDIYKTAGAATQRHDAMQGLHLMASADFDGPGVAAIAFFGKDIWRIGAAPDLPSIIGQGDAAAGSKTIGDSKDGLDMQAYSVSARYPFGAHSISASAGYMKAEWKGVDNPSGANDGSMWQAGVYYQYDLSKHAYLYAAASYADGNRLFHTIARYNQLMTTAGMSVSF